MPAHSYINTSRVTAHRSINRFDALNLLEYFIYLTILFDNSNLQVTGYTLWKNLAIHLTPKDVVFVSNVGATLHKSIRYSSFTGMHKL